MHHPLVLVSFFFFSMLIFTVTSAATTDNTGAAKFNLLQCRLNCPFVISKYSNNFQKAKKVAKCLDDCNIKANPKSQYGCHKGYCWSYCSATFVKGEWCYTSKESYSQSYKYVKCSQQSDCQKDWKCGGPCAAF